MHYTEPEASMDHEESLININSEYGIDGEGRHKNRERSRGYEGFNFLNISDYTFFVSLSDFLTPVYFFSMTLCFSSL